ALYQHLIAFTWPGANSVFPGYLLDKEEVARFAAFSLANLLADLRASQPERRVLLVAHSMGCYLALKALNMLSTLRSAQAEKGVLPVIVDQMAFYAADVNADAIQSGPLSTQGAGARATNRSENAAAQPRQAPAAAGESDDLNATMLARRRNGYGFQALDRVGRLTIYHSFHDNALIWSPLANFFTEESGGLGARARLGWCGPYNLDATHKNIVSVDCSACIYDHAAYFIRHEVLKHTAQVLAEPLVALPQRPYRAAPLQTKRDGAQQKAKRLWTWYTPAEMAREQWEKFFLYQPQWLRGLAAALNTLLLLAIPGGSIYALVQLVLQR
ncbi:MAG TPA: alpha/beta hydrolase, partial [Ktedonobacterales bacterium]